MSKYIHPMIESVLIGLIIPESPKSQKQKYYTI
ncbi:MAG: Fic family protein [Lachnospirales bacterium]